MKILVYLKDGRVEPIDDVDRVEVNSLRVEAYSNEVRVVFYLMVEVLKIDILK